MHFPLLTPALILREVCPRESPIKSRTVWMCVEVSLNRPYGGGGCSTLETRVRVIWSPNPAGGQSGTLLALRPVSVFYFFI